MHVEASNTYSMLMAVQGSYGAPTVADNNDETTHQASAAATGKAGEAANNAVSGTTTSRISAEMDRFLIDQQETDSSDTDTDNYDGPLSLAERHGLEDIANNPDYATRRSREIGIFGELVWVGKSLPGPNSTAAERNAFLARQNSKMARMEQVQGQRTAYYEKLTEQGLPPVEIFAKMLEFNANLPESHDDTLGWSKSGRANGMSYSDYNKAKLDYLRSLIGQGDAANTVDERILRPGEPDSLTSIANDPAFAAEKARELGTLRQLIVWDESQMPKNGDPASVWTAFAAKGEALVRSEEMVSRKREAFYDKMLADGVPSAEIYRELLKFNANLPPSHGDSLDQSGRTPPGDWTKWNQGRLDYLNQAMTQAGGADTGGGKFSPDSASAIASEVKEAPETHEISTRDTSLFEKLNFVSESDRKLLSAMTGYSVDKFGGFTDKNGKQGYPEDLTQHSLRTFQMLLLGARSGRSPDAIVGNDITKSEFIKLINQSRAVATSMGEKFNEELLDRGLAYLERLEANTAA